MTGVQRGNGNSNAVAGITNLDIPQAGIIALHFMANTFGKDHDMVKFMIDAFNREVQNLDDVEIWIRTCWGNPNM